MHLTRLSRSCAGARTATGGRVDEYVILFYLVRWCQKEEKSLSPDFALFSDDELDKEARNIAEHLSLDGARIERVIEKNGEEWKALWRELYQSVSSRTPRSVAEDLTQSALIKVVGILLTGTRPACARCRVDGVKPGRRECAECSRATGIDGPSNEYVFQSPFSAWAKAIAKNLANDYPDGPTTYGLPEQIEEDPPGEEESPDVDLESTLSAFLKAIDALRGAKQKAAIVASFCRKDVDLDAYRLLEKLAPKHLFDGYGPGLFESDQEIADFLGSTARDVQANRWAARRNLCKKDPRWGTLCDIFMPHASTKGTPREEAEDG
jgi:hypothetical protein